MLCFISHKSLTWCSCLSSTLFFRGAVFPQPRLPLPHLQKINHILPPHLLPDIASTIVDHTFICALATLPNDQQFFSKEFVTHWKFLFYWAVAINKIQHPHAFFVRSWDPNTTEFRHRHHCFHTFDRQHLAWLPMRFDSLKRVGHNLHPALNIFNLSSSIN